MVIFISFQFQIPQMDLEEVLGSILRRATINVPWRKKKMHFILILA